jgi:hypothetical protein
VGSSKRVPIFPVLEGDLKSPSNNNLFLPLISPNPPSPEFSPPLTLASPKKTVLYSDQKIILPPSPSVIASALVTDPCSAVTVFAFRMSGFFP